MEIIMKEDFFNKIYDEGLFSEKIKDMAVTTFISDSSGIRLISIQENYSPQEVDSTGSLSFSKDLFQTLFERGLLNKKQLSNFRLTLEGAKMEKCPESCLRREKFYLMIFEFAWDKF